MLGDAPKTDIYAKFTQPNNGYSSDVENGKKLTLNEYYKVSRISMGQSNTNIQLEGVKGAFNSSQFDFYDVNKQLVDIFTMPEFNHYLWGNES